MMTSTANAEKLAAATRAAPRVASVAPIVAQTRRTVADTANATEVMCQVVRRSRRVVACPPNLVEGNVCIRLSDVFPAENEARVRAWIERWAPDLQPSYI